MMVNLEPNPLSLPLSEFFMLNLGVFFYVDIVIGFEFTSITIGFEFTGIDNVCVCSKI